jgi:3-deoxy-D-manno-octulosonate 8-phosphate phosphatase (KDO 8-P phosphatase)
MRNDPSALLSAEVREKLTALSAIVFDFDGVFTDNTVRVDQNGIESVTCWRGDGLGLGRVRDSGIRLLILSTEENPVVSMRAAKLKTECICGVTDKARALRSWASDQNLSLANIAYVGNDINDISAFQCVGLPIAVADAYPEVLSYVKYTTAARGGYGAVREVCDLVRAACLSSER